METRVAKGLDVGIVFLIDIQNVCLALFLILVSALVCDLVLGGEGLEAHVVQDVGLRLVQRWLLNLSL